MLGRNEDSCVVEVRDQAGRRLLLTGDIPTAQEADILARQPWLQARAGDQTIVLAAHHGSKGSSGAVWLQQLRPDWLVVQAGYRNRFGHPHADVLARGQAAGAAIARTDLQGGLVLHWQAGSLTMESIHAQTRRFWHLDRLALRRD
jgi:competence protein ComEC